MKRTVGRAVVLTAVALALATSPAAGATFWDAPTGASAAGGPSAISYFEEIPCPPTAGDPGRRQKVRHRVRRKHPHVVKAKVVKPAVARPVVRPVVKRVAPAHPVVRRVVHKKPRKPAAPRLVRAAAVTLPKRCTVLHRDRLTFASLPLAREASDFSAAPDPVGVATAPSVLAPLVTGGPPFAPPSTLGSGGGGPGTVTAVSGAPEPDAWALMILGVGMAGAFLRRRGRGLAAA